MARNVALSNEAYGLLERLKRPGESFSDVVKRLGKEGSKSSWRDFAGIWKGDKEAERTYKRILKDSHRRLAKI